MTSQILTQKYLHTLFEYKDGELYWKIKPSKPVLIGDIAGCQDTNGYKKVKINGKLHGNHRIIFAMHNNYFPKQIDHINRVRNDNRIENLRVVTNAQNQWNTTKNARNTSGYKNVLWRKDKKKWTCRFKVNGKHIMRGSFNTAKEASVYAEWLREELHGEYKITTPEDQNLVHELLSCNEF